MKERKNERNSGGNPPSIKPVYIEFLVVVIVVPLNGVLLEKNFPSFLPPSALLSHFISNF